MSILTQSPKMSMLGVHPTGHGASASGARLSVGFGPTTPDYSQIAVAASGGWAHGVRVGDINPSEDPNHFTMEGLRSELETVMKNAVRMVLEEKRCVVLDCVLGSI